MKTQRLLLAFVAAILLLAVALVRVFLGDPDAARAQELREVAPASRADAAAEIARTETTGTRDVPASERSAIVAADEFGPDARSTEVGGVRLVVVKRGTTEPVPGARVTLFEKANLSLSLEQNEEGWLGPDPEKVIEAGGRTRTADARGELMLPYIGTQAFVAARKDALFGATELTRCANETCLLEIGPQRELRVRVVDARGAALAQMVVALANCEQSDDVWRARTDARGELTIRNLDFWLDFTALDSKSAFAVRLSTPCDPPIEEWLSPAHLPAEPVVLTAPASGSVQLAIVDASGDVLPISGHASVTARTRTRGNGRVYDFEPIDVRVPIVAGIALVERVGLGTQLSIEADLDGTGDTSLEVDGPKTSGERVQASVRLPADHCVLTGRVVDENGQVLKDTAFDWTRFVDDGQTIVASGRNPMRTNHDGRFHWTLRRETPANSGGASAHRIGFLRELSNAPIRRAATLDFSRALPAGLVELGDVRIVPHGPLVSGKVLDENGRAVVGVHLALNAQSNEAEKYDDAESGVDGSFAIWGPCLPIEFTLSAWSADHTITDEPRFRCGEGTAEFVIHATALGSIEGSALVDHEYEGSAFPLAFPDANGECSEDITYTRVLDRIAFTVPGRPAGKYSARVSIEGAPPIVEFENIEVVAGQCTRDPRLVDIDLRGKLPKAEKPPATVNPVDLTVVDARGQSISRGFLWLRDSGGDEDEILWGAGHARIGSNERRRVEIWAPGHRSTILHPPYSDARIVLASDLVAELALAIPKQLELPGLSFFVDVALPDEVQSDAGEGAPHASSRLQVLELGPGGKGELHLPAAGRYELALSVTRRASKPDEDVSAYGLGLVSSEIIVRETDGAQRYELRIDPTDLKTMLESLGIADEPR